VTESTTDKRFCEFAEENITASVHRQQTTHCPWRVASKLVQRRSGPLTPATLSSRLRQPRDGSTLHPQGLILHSGLNAIALSISHVVRVGHMIYFGQAAVHLIGPIQYFLLQCWHCSRRRRIHTLYAIYTRFPIFHQALWTLLNRFARFQVLIRGLYSGFRCYHTVFCFILDTETLSVTQSSYSSSYSTRRGSHGDNRKNSIGMRREKQYRHGLAVPYRPIIAFCRKSDPLQGDWKCGSGKCGCRLQGSFISSVLYFKVFSVVFHAVSPFPLSPRF